MKRFSRMALASLMLSPMAALAAPQRPNVLLLFADQHNADVMGVAGHPIVKTPNLDALAGQGVRFSRCYSQDGISVASRISLATGLYPRTTGVLYNGDEDRLDPQRRLYPIHQVLQSSGYRTGFFGKLHMGRRELLAGWDQTATVLPLRAEPLQESYWDWIKAQGKEAEFLRDFKNCDQSDLATHISQVPPELRDAAYVAMKTGDFLTRAAKEDKPFFCWASFHGPHQPYTPPKKWADLYPPESIPLPESLREPAENLPPLLANGRKNEKTPWNLARAAREPILYQRYIAAYYAQVTEVDHYIGEILTRLEALNLRENTIIIYTSDHGDFVGRHGMVEKSAVGHNVYEETLHVPLLIAWPRNFQKGATCTSLSELVDLYPTLAEMLKLERPAEAPKLPGRSLVKTLTQGAPIERAYAFSENWTQLTIIGPRYKLGTWIDGGTAHRAWDMRGKTKDQLFDRQNDPQELTNLAGQEQVAAVEAQLRTALASWLASVSDEGRQAISQELLKPRKAKGQKP